MPRTLKVYGANTQKSSACHLRANRNGRVRTVMATTSWVKFSKALRDNGCFCTANYLRTYGSVTGKKKELEICLANPEKIYYSLQHTIYGYMDEYYPWDYVPTDDELKRKD